MTQGFFGKSIRRKALLNTLVTLALVSFSVEAVHYWWSCAARQEFLLDQAAAIAAAQAAVLAPALREHNDALIGQMVQALAKYPDIAAVVVQTTNLSTVAQSGTDLAKIATELTLKQAVVYRGEGREQLVGQLVLGLSPQDLPGGWAMALLDGLTMFVALAAAMTLSLRRGIRQVTSPLQEITAALRRLAVGDREVRFSGLDRSDEIGEVARAVEVFRRYIAEVQRQGALEAGEIAKREHEERLHLVVDSMPIPVLMARTSDSRLLFGNRRLREVFQFTDQDPIGEKTTYYYVDPRDQQRLYERLMQDGFAADFETQLRRRDGSTFWALISITLTTFQGESVVLAGIYDITERHRIEEELKRAKQRAEEATQSKSDFLARMSHEIRTPMNSMLGLSHLALKTELNAQQRNYLNKIWSSGQHLLNIVNEILDFSKIEAGRLLLDRAEFELAKVLDNAIGLVQEKAKSKGLGLIVDVDREVPTHLIGDPLRLVQILVNYTGNAIKFTEQGVVSVQVQLRASNDNASLLYFSVKDTGIGLTEDQLGALFQSFSQADASTARKFGGTGLGLVICKKLAELMGGEVGVHSEYGVGSVFWFTAWLEKSPSTAAISQASASSSTLERQLTAIQGARVLLVEDNDINQEVAKAILQTAGLIVDLADNGAIAVEKVQQTNYDLVLMDMLMPVLDGVGATLAIKRLPNCRHLPIVAMTANAMQADREKCQTAGMVDFVGKPIDPDDLWRTLLKWIPPRTTPRPLPTSLPAHTIVHLATKVGADETVDESSEVALARLGVDNINGLNAHYGLRTALGTPSLYLTLLKKFVTGQADALAQIELALNAQRWELAERLAHTLKSVAANIGATPLQREMALLEIAIKERQPRANVDRLTVLPEAHLAALVRELSAKLAPDAAAIHVTVDSDHLRKVCDRLIVMLADDNPKAGELFDTHINTLRVGLAENFAAIEKNIRNFNFEIALAQLQQVVAASDGQDQPS